ncbi:MAG TPA: tetratricopeptide repeat protein [Vicinamibacterales bacterium]|nr:tetratricopeptide repeat protein [Vicinamibacterales bacterium]
MSFSRLSVLAGALAIFALSTSGTAQAPRRPMTPVQAAQRALVEGRYGEVESLTEKLDAKDPTGVALRARALVATGRYADAEVLLRPAAQRAPSSEAALQLGLLEHLLGKDPSATLAKVAALAETSDDPIELARAARALRTLGRPQEANAAFRDGAMAAGPNPEIQTAWGDLFLEKYNKAEALRSYQMALQYDAKYAPALLGAARTLADENPPQAVQFAKRALEINPNSVDAHVFLAEQAADADRHDEARAELKKALDVNPASLEAHALLGAIAYVEDKTPEYESEIAKALAIVPGYGEAYRVVAERAAHKYRFDEAVALARRAIALDPKNARAYADLGMDLMRTGDEAAARVAINKSFDLDNFDDTVRKNLETVLDKLDKFTTVRDGDLIIRMDPDEAPVLGEYAMPLAKRALETFSKRYEFVPRGPILVEIFPKHDDFAVRNLGLPGAIGALGICFGRVVSIDSPHARPPGEFQWEATLWHELAHVITLQMSNQRIPRWLTEGISEYEETRAHPEWRRDMDLEYATLLNRNEDIKLKDLNAAFQDPKKIQLAYYEGSLLVEHMVKTYGDAAMNRLIRAFAQGLDTDAALKATLNVDLAQMQTGFDRTIEQKFGDMRRAMAMPEGVTQLGRLPLAELQALAQQNPKSFPIQMTLGATLRKSNQLDEAMAAFERAAALIPTAAGHDSPHAQMAAIASQKKDDARVVTELTALVAVDGTDVEAARQLAATLRKTKVEDPQKLRPVYQRIASLDPFDAEAHRYLGRDALDRNDTDTAVREFRAVVALGPVDRAAAYTDLAESYFKSGRKAEAKKQTLAALEIAPTYERAQDLLLKLVDK